MSWHRFCRVKEEGLKFVMYLSHFIQLFVFRRLWLIVEGLRLRSEEYSGGISGQWLAFYAICSHGHKSYSKLTLALSCYRNSPDALLLLIV